MSRSITIRNVPDATASELASRAAASGRSLQEYLRDQLVQRAETPDVATLLAEIRARKARTGTTLSREDVLAARDSDRR